MNAITRPTYHFRAIWISDIHLGTRGCNADLLMDFLRRTESDYLYLVGDIIDVWRMRNNWYWHQAHNDIIQKVMRKARKGTRVIYVPGNHDECFRDFAPRRFGRVAILPETFHITTDGRRFLVLHGDQFDGVVKHARWLAIVGDGAYNLALSMNVWFNYARRRLGFSYWSLSAYLKHKVKNAVEFICRFEEAVVAEARRQGADGVIAGHIHTAEIREIDGVVYCNDGDWVESCTALVEHRDGTMEILRWAEMDDVKQMYAMSANEKKSLPRKLTEKKPTEKQQCESSLSQTPGFLKSMASFVRLKL